MIKGYGGTFSPASDEVADKINRFKFGLIYEVDIKQGRNQEFHGKVFAFFNFCFEYWAPENIKGIENLSMSAQKKTFRNQLTVLAGYKEVTYKLDGSLRVEAKSLSYASMEQAEFEECYSALINAAIRHVFASTTDDQILDRLQGFF